MHAALRKVATALLLASLILVVLAKQPSKGSACWCADEPDGIVPLRDGRLEGQEERQMLQTFAGHLEQRMVATTKEFDPATTGAHMYQCLFCDAREDPAALPQSFGLLQGKQLFVDDYLIKSSTGVERFLEEATELEGEVFTRSEGWESSGWGFPGSVNYNGSHFLLHYSATRTLTSSPTLGVAISSDGVKWEKHLINNSFSVYHGGDFCVLLDDHEFDAQRLYKMVYNCGHPKDFVCIATSPDGIAWRNRGRKYGRATDTVPCLYAGAGSAQERAGGPLAYELIIRQNFATPIYWRGIRGTQVLRVDGERFLSDLTRPASNVKIPFQQQGQWYFDRFGKLEWLRRQSYAHTRTFYEGVYLGLITLYEWPIVAYMPIGPEKWERLVRDTFIANHTHNMDTVRPYLATSRDGVHYNFQWVYSNQPLRLPRGLEYKFVQSAAQLVFADGAHWLFYSASPGTHHDRWDHEERFFAARFPQDRLSGLSPARRGGLGVVTTKPFSWPQDAATLLLNIEVPSGSFCEVWRLSSGSSGRVLLANITDGPQTGNEVDVPVGPQARSDRSPTQKEVNLQFKMRGLTRLYAFRLLRRCELQHQTCVAL